MKANGHRARLHPLKKFRQAHGLSQAQAAERFGLKQTSWSRLESRKRYPKRDLARRLMRATGLSLEELLGIS